MFADSAACVHIDRSDNEGFALAALRYNLIWMNVHNTKQSRANHLQPEFSYRSHILVLKLIPEFEPLWKHEGLALPFGECDVRFY